MTDSNKKSLARWRLVLGKYTKPEFQDELSGSQTEMDDVLEQLYSRTYKGRGQREQFPAKEKLGGLEPSQINVPSWLQKVRELFPKETCEKITGHALEKFGLTEILNDPETLRNMQPSTELLSALLTLKGRMSGAVMQEARRLIKTVVEDIKKKLRPDLLNALYGKRNRFAQTTFKSANNFDALRTIRRNLKHWNPELKKLVVSNPRFYRRAQPRLPWEIIICVDQSGSMVDSVIHSAVMAGVLASLPMVQVRLVLFDTSIVDLSAHVDDPVEVLMSAQLGGGTNIGQAVNYCEGLVSQPRRTIFVLITDFCEGADPRVLVRGIRRLREAGVRLIGLASLNASATAWYDKTMAARLANEGMEIAALTPLKLAVWLADVMQKS
ncbi:MAG: VWA domain-containing protein [Candidatus Obscuribacterales bacterium]|nr:VWA domain-containing protein [Candidatus Obscuribacterales bacterium]